MTHYEITDAESAEHALGLIASARFDLIIADLQLPQMHGTEMIRIVRDTQPNVPILVISGTMPSHVLASSDTARRLGASKALAKPVRKAELRSTVADLLAAASRNGAG